MPAGIKHIEFWVSSLQKSLSFYRRLFFALDWIQVENNAFSDGKIKIYFVQQPEHAVRSAGPRHICFLAENEAVVDRSAAVLKEHGAAIIRGPVRYEYKNRVCYTVDFKDPDGYVLEVATKSEEIL